MPFAYAAACVEVVAKSSEKAATLYHQTIESWGNPNLKTVYEALISEVPDSELDKVKNALLHPETGFLPDPNKPFEELEKVFASHYSLGRFSRDPVHGVILMLELEKHGVILEAATEIVDNTEAGKLVLYIKGYAAKLDAERRRDATGRGKKALLKEGRLPQGTGLPHPCSSAHHR